MTGIGEQLRDAREARGLTLDQAERQTRMRTRLLAALEAEDLTAFASPAQARGFLRNYAEFLGLDPAEATAAMPAAPPAGRSPARPAAPPATGGLVVRGGWRRFWTRDLLIGSTVTLLVLLLLAWGGWQLWQSASAPAATAAPSLAAPAGTGAAGTGAAGTADALASAATTPAADTPAPATPTQPLPTPLPNYVGVNLLIRAEQRIWLRVRVDEAETFMGQLAPGETREFVGNQVVEVWTGNARGTRVVFNGQDQGTLGELGQVVIRLWTLGGVLTPTATTTATAAP